MVAPATEGAVVVLVTEAIGGERIAVVDECCDSGIGCGLILILMMRAFAAGVLGSLSCTAGLGGAGGVHPTLRKLREGWGTRGF